MNLKDKNSDSFFTPLISIIIPCYNCELTISKCLDSVINNTYKNIEIICINDGSSDRTLELLSSYCDKYNFITIINQENRGQGYSRNRGLEKAKGEYVAFLDSDDSYESRFLETMISLIEGSDIAICGYYYDSANNKTSIAGPCEGIIKNYDFWKYNFVDPVWSVVVWNKLFKASVLKNIRFKENVFFEDEFFATDVFSKNYKMACTTECLYYYCENDKSTMKTTNLYKKIYRGEARNIRGRYFVENKYDVFYNKTMRENLYLLLKVQKYAKKEGKKDYLRMSDNCLSDLNSIIIQSINKGMNNCWDLYFYSKHRLLFEVSYGMRCIFRAILKRNGKND